ncbi:MAG: hypothetical protein ACRDPD_11015 [Streptosporangiaceae bacterium]
MTAGMPGMAAAAGEAALLKLARDGDADAFNDLARAAHCQAPVAAGASRGLRPGG